MRHLYSKSHKDGAADLPRPLLPSPGALFDIVNRESSKPQLIAFPISRPSRTVYRKAKTMRPLTQHSGSLIRAIANEADTDRKVAAAIAAAKADYDVPCFSGKIRKQSELALAFDSVCEVAASC